MKVGECLADYSLIYNERSASYKKARKKWNHRLTGSVKYPVTALSEDWLKEQSSEGLIVMGGDGTVHSVANTVLRSGRDIPMGIIPGGGGNDFFKRLHELDDQSAYYEVFEVAYPDSTENRYALNSVEWGIGAMVARKRDNNEGKFLVGMLKYLYLTIKSLVEYKSWRATVSLDGKNMEFQELSAVFVGFGSSTMGGGFNLFPDELSRLHGENPFVLIAEGFSRLNALGLILKFAMGKQDKGPGVKYYPFQTIELIPHDSADVMLTIDGELTPAPPVRISLSNKKLNVFCVH